MEAEKQSLICLREENTRIKEFNFIIRKIKNFFEHYQILRDGYYGYRIGQKLRILLRDSKGNLDYYDFYIIDILIEEKENFGLLLVFASNIIKDYDRCLLAKYLSRDNFEIIFEKDIIKDKKWFYKNKRRKNKIIYQFKFFKIPKRTYDRLLYFYSNFEKPELFPNKLKKIISFYKKVNE